MITKKSSYLILLSFILFPLTMIATEDYPIIFVHGIQGDPRPIIAWGTWNHPNSAMNKIVNSGYGGYKWGLREYGWNADQCLKTTQLQSTSGDPKRIYHFSYYYGDGSYMGVIGGHGRYYPMSYAYDYQVSEGNSSYAQLLADFINKVLAATSAPKVDIVAHSMGGVVARAAIAWYGCENKVGKLLTVGTPNNTYYVNDFVEAIVANWFPGYQDWQKKGELLELGINYESKTGGALFFDAQNPGTVATYLDWLALGEPQIHTACIAGNKDQCWSELFDDNDGIVFVTQAHLPYAQFNPTIHVTHARDWATFDEGALVTCTYTTEFIKKWIIDDEVLPDFQISTSDFWLFPSPVGLYEQYVGIYTNLSGSWDPILSSVFNIVNLAGQIVQQKGIGWNSAEGMDRCFYPVLSTSPGFFPANGVYFIYFRHQNMQDGDIEEGEGNYSLTVVDHGGEPASVSFDLPVYVYFGRKMLIGNALTINANVIGQGYTRTMLDTTYFYKYTTETDYRECELDAYGQWTVPAPPPPPISGPIQYNVKAVVNLDPITTISAEDIITVPFDLALRRREIKDEETFGAISLITAGSDNPSCTESRCYFIVYKDERHPEFWTGEVTMVAGDSILLCPGTEVQEGCYLYAYIDPSFKGSTSSLPTQALTLGTTLEPDKAEESTPNTSAEVSSEKTKEPIPTVFSCAQNYPNPFMVNTAIKYGLPKNCDNVNLTIFNIAGQAVRTLVNGQESAGFKSVSWNGKNSAGIQVPQGVYFYVFKADDFEKHHKMILVK
ncbi:alpha/beta fold hydrolase [candidate division WOR-3 bacterium]|nr:alpha/beta fold hydrolase [candidate division WOR-3 bacterium]